jgi:hypothetical protein
MPICTSEFDSVPQQIEQRIRCVVDDFKAKCSEKDWKVSVRGAPEWPNFKVSITAPDDESVSRLVTKTLDAGSYIHAALEAEREKWQIRTTPLESA